MILNHRTQVYEHLQYTDTVTAHDLSPRSFEPIHSHPYIRGFNLYAGAEIRGLGLVWVQISAGAYFHRCNSMQVQLSWVDITGSNSNVRGFKCNGTY